MQYDKIILSPIPLDELEDSIRTIIREELAKVNGEPSKFPDDQLITAKEVSKLLSVSMVTIHKWKKDGKLKFYRYGSRIRFKKTEILNGLVPKKYGRYK